MLKRTLGLALFSLMLLILSPAVAPADDFLSSDANQAVGLVAGAPVMIPMAMLGADTDKMAAYLGDVVTAPLTVPVNLVRMLAGDRHGGEHVVKTVAHVVTAPIMIPLGLLMALFGGSAGH